LFLLEISSFCRKVSVLFAFTKKAATTLITFQIRSRFLFVQILKLLDWNVKCWNVILKRVQLLSHCVRTQPTTSKDLHRSAGISGSVLFISRCHSQCLSALHYGAPLLFSTYVQLLSHWLILEPILPTYIHTIVRSAL
jgi:hypothetical protein